MAPMIGACHFGREHDNPSSLLLTLDSRKTSYGLGCLLLSKYRALAGVHFAAGRFVQRIPT